LITQLALRPQSRDREGAARQRKSFQECVAGLTYFGAPLPAGRGSVAAKTILQLGADFEQFDSQKDGTATVFWLSAISFQLTVFGQWSSVIGISQQ
jgi:hypothetical protein